EVTAVRVDLDVMNDEQKQALRASLQGGRPARTIRFSEPGSLTKVYAIASGKGGVGKSSTTVNLAVAMAQQGLAVGVVDADVYGHSLPRMLGVEHPPAIVDGMIVPPEAHGVKVVSAGMFVEGNRPIVWRGPMLHRALEPLLADSLSRLLGVPVPLLGSVPIDPRLTISGDAGTPIVLSAPESPAAVALTAIATELVGRGRSLVGRPLSLTPVTG